MSRLEVPLRFRTLRATGDTVVWADLDLRNLLGLTGVINQMRLTFDGTTSALAPWGILVVEKR